MVKVKRFQKIEYTLNFLIKKNITAKEIRKRLKLLGSKKSIPTTNVIFKKNFI